MLRILWLSVFLCILPVCVAEAKDPLIAAASSLRHVMPQLEQAFIAQGGGKLRLSFGSSGNLSRQILQGAPHELFLSADTSYVATLVRAGRAQDEGLIYAYGRLALIVANHSRVSADDQLKGLKSALEAGYIKHFAIANPQHAPYGRAARQVLGKAGILEKIRPFLIYGENIAQTAQFAISSAAQGGLVSHSLGLAPAIKSKTRQALVPASWHQPLVHHMVLLKNASPQALRFYQFMSSSEAQSILARHGFSPAH